MNPNVKPFYDILLYLYKEGREVAPRGAPCREVTDFHYTLAPRVRFMCFDRRGLRLDYVKQELLWYLRGDRKDVSIKKMASIWAGIINLDGSVNSNYGHYIFNPEAGRAGSSNFIRMLEELARDPSSRRAAICILDNGHLNSDTKDYPCTSYLNFHVRDDKLEMYVRMRSQDAIFGMGNDAPAFSFVHELAWATLEPVMPGLQLGNYHHSADSFHVYERHYELLEKLLQDPEATTDYHQSCPQMIPDVTLLAQLRTIATGKYVIETDGPLQPFSQWLLTRDDRGTLLPAEHAS